MEVAKLSKYARREDIANVFFACFVLSWFASRMFYFPLWIIRSAWSEPITVSRLWAPDIPNICETLLPIASSGFGGLLVSQGTRGLFSGSVLTDKSV